MILGALYGTANATVVTSPIYMPESGKIVSNISIGKQKTKYDKVFDSADKKTMEESWKIEALGKIGLTEKLALNYDFDFRFDQKENDLEKSASFKEFSIGLTGRAFESGANKFDVIFNVGQSDFFIDDQAFADLTVRYGLDLDMYNLGFSFGARYYNESKKEYGDDEKYKADPFTAFRFDLENEFIFTKNFTMGLDLFYEFNPEIKTKETELDSSTGALVTTKTKIKSFDRYGFNVDANYGINDNNFIGVYFGMDFTKDFEDITGKDPKETEFGIKYTTQF